MKILILLMFVLFCSASMINACDNITVVNNSTSSLSVNNNTTIEVMVNESNITDVVLNESEIKNNITSFVDEEIVKNLTIESPINETGVAVYTGIEKINATGIHDDDTENVGELATGNPLTLLIIIFFNLIPWRILK